jgi:hypothetical protein
VKERKNERPADLLFWFGDGCLRPYRARVAADVEISIGRTDSKRALGFVVRENGEAKVDFVLNRDQVAELAAYLQTTPGRLKRPLGRKRNQLSLIPPPPQTGGLRK